MRFKGPTISGYALAVILGALAPALSHAHSEDFTTPAQQEAVMKEIGVDERLGATLPADAVFTDQYGKKVRLGDLYAGKPVILTLNYYGCPMLCPITLGNLGRAMEEMKGLQPGRDYKVITVSINPDETARDARARADETYRMLAGFKGPEGWWPFLTGGEGSIESLTKAVGFRYKKIGASNFAHPTVFIVLTPDGSVSRYLYGVESNASDLRLALIEAADGRVGASTALNRVLLYCYHYDPVGRRYQVIALNIMKIVGALSLVFLGVVFIAMRKYERGRKDA